MRLAVVHEPDRSVLANHRFGQFAYAGVARSERDLLILTGCGLRAEALLAHVLAGPNEQLARNHRRRRDGNVALGLVPLLDCRLLAALLQRAADRQLRRRKLVDDHAVAAGALLEERLNRRSVRPGEHPVDVLDLRVKPVVSRRTELHNSIAGRPQKPAERRARHQHLRVGHLLAVLDLELADTVLRIEIGELLHPLENRLVNIRTADDERTEVVAFPRLVAARMGARDFRMQDVFVTELDRDDARRHQLKLDEVLRTGALHAELALAVLLLCIQGRVELLALDRIKRIRHLPLAEVAVHHQPEQKLLLVVREFERIGRLLCRVKFHPGRKKSWG